jgi:hypothetical protein
MYLPDTRARLSATSGLKFLTEAHEAGTGAKDSHWFVRGHEWNGCRHCNALRKAFRDTSHVNRSRKMKKHLCLVCGALAGITILHFTAFVETAKPNSTADAPAAISAPLKTDGQSSKKNAKDCEDEWRADQEAMMKHGMTEDSYVEQCSVEDDVPAIPSETKTNAAPSAAPK